VFDVVVNDREFGEEEKRLGLVCSPVLLRSSLNDVRTIQTDGEEEDQAP